MSERSNNNYLEIGFTTSILCFAHSGGLKVLRAPGKKQYAGPFQQCWKKDQILLYGSIV